MEKFINQISIFLRNQFQGLYPNPKKLIKIKYAT